MSFEFSLLKYTPLGLLLTLLANCFYNRYFHPLRHIPGPFFASITEGYKLYLLFFKHIPSHNYDLHKIYGPIVRVAPGLVSFSDPQQLPVIYHRYADKSDFYTHGVLGEQCPTVQTLDHMKHAPKRRLVAPLFSMKNIRLQENRLDEHILEIQRTLKNQFSSSRSSLEFTQWIRWFLLDAITHTLYGEPAGFVREGRDVNQMISGLRQMSLFALLLGTFPWLLNPIINRPVFRKWIIPQSANNYGAGRMMSYRDKAVKARINGPPKPETSDKDFLDILLQMRSQNPDAMDIEDVGTECLMLMVAALDSTAGLICPLINNIIQHPKVYESLMTEIEASERRADFSEPIATYDETCELPYFMACIQETIRFSPSVPVILPRYAPPEGLHLHGIWIPGGTEIGANPYVINRDEKVFGADSGVFQPNRWLQAPEKVKEMEKSIFTFGHGSRECLGSRFARLETQKLVLQLLRNFHFSLETSSGPWAVHEDRGFAIYEKQWLKLSERVPKRLLWLEENRCTIFKRGIS